MLNSRFLMFLRISYTCILTVVLGIAVSIVFSMQNGAGDSPAWLSTTTMIAAVVCSGFMIFDLTQRSVGAERKRHYLQASQLSKVDELTGALNRRAFFADLREALSQENRLGFAFLKIDMNGLRSLNETLGLRAGDEALACLVSSMRHVAPNAAIGRLGDSEFGVVVPDCATKTEAFAVLELFRRQWAEAMMVEAGSWPVSATCSVLIVPDDAACVDDIIVNSDLALARGKARGGGQITAYNADMRAFDHFERTLQRDMRAGLQSGEFEVHYQPVVHAQTGALRSYEALLRWKHPSWGMISPSHFIPIAERSGMIHALGEWLLQRVAADFPVLAVEVVTINVSGVQLSRPDFAESFIVQLQRLGLATDHIVIEITETNRFEPDTVEMKNLRELREAGVEIAIDDFGAGHASLHYLQFIPFQKIKIDRSYVAQIENDPASAALIAAVCSLGRALGARVVAEGVETETQKTLLIAAGCTHLQGYLIGKPQPLAAIIEERGALAAA